jgi:hypothetical protein
MGTTKNTIKGIGSGNHPMSRRNLMREKPAFTREEIIKAVEDYFEYTDQNAKPLTMAGLAYYLGIDNVTLFRYRKKKENYDFYDVIENARAKVILALEEKLNVEGKAGQIFLAKNYGYTDRQEIVNKTSSDIDKELKEFEQSLYEE